MPIDKNLYTVSLDDEADAKEEAEDKKLKSLSERFRSVSRAMRNRVGSLKKSIHSHREKSKLLKASGDYIKSYVKKYKYIDEQGSERFWKLIETYGLELHDKFDPKDFKDAFKSMERTARTPLITARTLSKLFREINLKTKQKSPSAGAFMFPHLAFSQPLMRVPLLLGTLLKTFSSADFSDERHASASIEEMKRVIDEIEEKMFKKFSLIDCDKLRDSEYRSKCKKRLEKVVKKILQFCDVFNKAAPKIDEVDMNMGTLVMEFYK